MKNKLLILLILFSIINFCGVTSAQAQGKFINILGSSRGFYEDKIEIKKDVKISTLRIRQTKILDDSICSAGYRYIIELDGKINSDTTYALQQIIDDTPKCINAKTGNIFPTLIYLNSGGGNLNDGIAIGKLFRRNFDSVAAITDSKQVCASACAIAFIGAVHKNMDENSQLLFHAPYESNFGEIICSSKEELKDLKTYMVEMLKFMGGASVGERLFDRMMSVCSSNNGWIINRDAAKLYKIIH